ncbi:hypothetical protein FOL47_003630, partial [Perkinsus chesapeaki]
TAAGQVCHGTDVSCSSLLVEGRRLEATDVGTCWSRLGSTIPDRSVHVWNEESITPADVPVIDSTTPIGTGSSAAALNLPAPWYVGGEEVEDLKSYGIVNPDIDSMRLANLPVRRWLVKDTKSQSVEYAVSSVQRSFPKKTSSEFYGAHVNPRTILALHEA